MDKQCVIQLKLLLMVTLLQLGITEKIVAQDTPLIRSSSSSGVETEIYINCSKEKAWALLMDFEGHEQWNPYIKIIKGKKQIRKKVKVYIKSEPPKNIKFSAKILDLEENKIFSWGGRFLTFFSAKHYFKIEEITPKRIKFIQGEYWKGWFGKTFGKKWYKKTTSNFLAMNNTMKKKLEHKPD